MRILLFSITILLSFFAMASNSPEELKQLEIDLGEKLFLEERFSKSYFLAMGNDVNKIPKNGDPNLNHFFGTFNNGIHPNKGKHFSCATCHLVDQANTDESGLVFVYNDNLSFSPVPFITKKSGVTLRNSMNLANVVPFKNAPLHWDGEFFSSMELTCHSLTGPNMGWELKDHHLGMKHIASVLLNDNGSYPTDTDLTESYQNNFMDLNIEIQSLNKHKVFHLACKAIAAYFADLSFSKNEKNQFDGSAYDQFLAINNIKNTSNDNSDDYIAYLMAEVERTNLKFIKPTPLKYHKVVSQFTELELEGFKIFGGRGQCIKCHVPPLFTDSGFHNIGLAQTAYENIHSFSQFNKLNFPNFEEKTTQQNINNFPTFRNPSWTSPYRQKPNKIYENYIDLGLWNNFAHPDKAHNQDRIKTEICNSYKFEQECSKMSKNDFLEKSFALFKTPSLRSLGQSAPYFHDGSKSNFNEIFTHYLTVSDRALNEEIKNPDPKLYLMKIKKSDFKALSAFLNSLNEDYD